jgi:hypothetical protein
LMALTLDTPLIGLVAGADLHQVQLSSRFLRLMGFSHQAFACGELTSEREFRFLARCAEIIRRNATFLMFIGYSHPSFFSRFPAVDSFAGMFWFHNALYGRRFGGDKVPRRYESGIQGFRACVN